MGLGTILIRADASPEIGTGHVMRCLALAQAWQDRGGNVVFAMANSMPAIQQRLWSEHCHIVAVAQRAGSHEDAAFTRHLAQELAAQCVVLDSYGFDAEYQRLLHHDVWTLVCLDDEGRAENYNADIVLNQNITATPSWYRKRRSGTQLLLGPSFCLLRREFDPWRGFRRETVGDAHHILVTLGGSPPAEIIRKIVESLSAAESEDLRVAIVLGGSLEHGSDQYAAGFRGELIVHRNVLDMAPLMKAADIAISAAGSTCWELCLLGVPMVLLDVAGNQTPVALELEKRKCAMYAGSANSFTVSGLAETVTALMGSPMLRERLSLRSRQLVDGLGAQRVIGAIQEMSCPAGLALRAVHQ